VTTSGPGVQRAGDLVQQLGGDRPDRDRAAGAGVLGDHRAAVGGDLGDGEAGVERAGDLLPDERVVAAGGLRAALEDVADRDGAGQPVPVVAGPAEVRGGGPDDQRGVGDPAGDDHLRTLLQSGRDAPGAQVGVGRQRDAVERGAGVEVGERTEVGDAGQQVVALDVRDRQVEAEGGGEVAHRLGAGRRGQARRR
jgi:hypothetical protein